MNLFSNRRQTLQEPAAVILFLFLKTVQFAMRGTFGSPRDHSKGARKDLHDIQIAIRRSLLGEQR